MTHGGTTASRNSDESVMRELNRILSAAKGKKRAIEIIKSLNRHESTALLYRLEQQCVDPHDDLPLPIALEGRVVVDSREVSPKYPKRIENKEDAISYYLWSLTNFKDYRGFMTKKDFWRFFDYKAFLRYREVVSFEHAGVFYVLMLYPYNYS